MTVFALDQSFSLSGLDDGREVSTCLKHCLVPGSIAVGFVRRWREGEREGVCVCVRAYLNISSVLPQV